MTDNAQAGRINGQRLASTIPFKSEPGLGSSSSVVVRCESIHNNPRAVNRRASDFRNLRKACHLRVGARVMLSLNTIWNVQTVPLGLMNGARGVVVAICYPPMQSQRVDGEAVEGTGWPALDSRGMARGIDNCPLPDFVVVHFPSYKGPQIFPGLPSTWVPIPCCEVRSQTSKACTRIGVPLKLAWALTIHKSQGITAPEGTLISFEGSRMPRAASKPGLAFVGWTRATTWEKVVFQKLPPIEDFLAVRMQSDFKARTVFEAEADKFHDELLLRHGITESAHIADHQEHLKRVIKARDGRAATQAELDDVASMLKCRGVAPMPTCIQEHLQQRGKVTSTNGIWGICMAFRADTSARKEARKHLAQSNRPSLGSRFDARNYISQELTKAADAHCEEAPPLDDEEECNWCAAAIASLGFDEDLVTRILEENDFSFPETLSYFMNGMDSARDVTRFRRHTRKKVVCGINVEKLASVAVRNEYIERANAEFGHLRFAVVDLGQHACSTTGACFWLCLAAGLSGCDWHIDAQDMPGIADCESLLAEMRQSSPHLLDRAPSNDVEHSAVGRFAYRLRQHMCAGVQPVMLRHTMMTKIYAAFASLGGRDTDGRNLEAYKNWVQKLATKEYADELVVIACALELRVCIVCVPHTPNGLTHWKITRYQPPGEQLPEGKTIYLGNNDVHYMWLPRQ